MTSFDVAGLSTASAFDAVLLGSGVPGMRIKRLFDEKKFHGYGPYGYDVKKLIAREQAVRARQRRKPA